MNSVEGVFTHMRQGWWRGVQARLRHEVADDHGGRARYARPAMHEDAACGAGVWWGGGVGVETEGGLLRPLPRW